MRHFITNAWHKLSGKEAREQRAKWNAIRKEVSELISTLYCTYCYGKPLDEVYPEEFGLRAALQHLSNALDQDWHPAEALNWWEDVCQAYKTNRALLYMTKYSARARCIQRLAQEFCASMGGGNWPEPTDVLQDDWIDVIYLGYGTMGSPITRGPSWK